MASSRLYAGVLFIHRWLGLITLVIVTLVCATGAILSFEDEITEALHPQLFVVEPQAARVPLGLLVESAGELGPDVRVSSLSVHSDPERSVELSLGRGDTVYANPYTGEVLGRRVYRETAFFTVFALHRWLLADDVGKWIVGTSTLLFCIILMTGLWVWIPSSWKRLRRRLTVRRRGGIKRLLYDLHVSVGIYVVGFLFLMAFTGLQWSFDWFSEGIVYVSGATTTQTEPPEVTQASEEAASLDELLSAARRRFDEAPSVRIRMPDDGPVAVSALEADAPHPMAYATLYLHPSDASELGFISYDQQSGADQIHRTFYAIHIGSILGWPTRVLWFLSALIGATLPLTGFWIWWQKRRVKGRASKRRKSAEDSVA